VTAKLVQERVYLTQAVPQRVMGDTAYGAESVAQAVERVSTRTTVVAPVPPVVRRAGRFSKLDFTIDTQAHTVTCPAGHTVDYLPKRRRRNTKPDRVVKMDAALCEICPLRQQCRKGKGDRARSRCATRRPGYRASERRRRTRHGGRITGSAAGWSM